jgi:hypothetical protein
VDDAIQGIWYMKFMGLREFRESFGYSGFYYGHFLIFKLIYSICGIDTLRWFLVFSFMHAINTLLLSTFFDKLLRALDFPRVTSGRIALSASLLFLLSPYHSENIIWGATSHYFFTFFLLLMICHGCIKYLQGFSTKAGLVFMHLTFAFALVTLEISFLFPVVLGMLFLLFYINNKTNVPLRSYFLKLLLPQIALIVLYFLCLKWKFGYWIPYGREGKDAIVPLSYMITTLAQHLMKLFGFIHFTAYTTRASVYELAVHWKESLAVLLLLFAVLSFRFWKQSKAHMRVFWFFAMTGIIFFAPFIRVYFMYLFPIENNRYSYFASAFLLPAFTLFLYSFPSKIRNVVYVIVVGLFLYFIVPTVKSYQQAARLHSKYLNQFPDTITGRMFILNVPYNCSNAYVFREAPRLTMALQILRQKDFENRLHPVAWYNAQTVSDAFAAARISENTYVIQQKTPGSWWMYEHLGATNYENDLYRFETGEGNSCTITFKQALKPDDAVLFFNGKRFIRLNE